jgi:hypothetical protein
MDLPDELYSYIFGFLSPKEKIIMREVNCIFKNLIKWITLVTYKMDNLFPKVCSVERKKPGHLCLINNNTFLFHVEYIECMVHSVFRMNNHPFYRCINVDCREKRLGNIYISKNPHLQVSILDDIYHLYYKRKIPYCLSCFKKFYQKKTTSVVFPQMHA